MNVIAKNVNISINCQFDTNFKVIFSLLVSEHVIMTQKGTDSYTNVMRKYRAGQGGSHKSGNV